METRVDEKWEQVLDKRHTEQASKRARARRNREDKKKAIWDAHHSTSDERPLYLWRHWWRRRVCPDCGADGVSVRRYSVATSLNFWEEGLVYNCPKCPYMYGTYKKCMSDD
ncbi:hypothetical protein LCGC14_2076690 [marine sediment metagenome]|uniref:Uncharacterized protein n=1 Tax=marine sediment metagenome TaxID=412755 RepID=A0A0F9EH30_9ZZZZ